MAKKVRKNDLKRKRRYNDTIWRLAVTVLLLLEFYLHVPYSRDIT